MIFGEHSPRASGRVHRRLHVACIVILILNILYILVHAMFHSSPTLKPGQDCTCPRLRLEFTVGGVHSPAADEQTDPQDWGQGILETAGQDLGLARSPVNEGQLGGDHGEDEGYALQSVKEPGPSFKVCPEFPTNMRGELVCQCDPVTPEVIQSLWPNLEPGGRLRPSTCTPRERLAIIIPYRDRFLHLHTLIRNLLPILAAQNVDATFFVIEQLAPSMFNRATLHNVGFLESQQVGRFDCYIFHDVDLVPMDDRILYRCGDNPRHLPVSIKRYGRRAAKKMYDAYFGGVVALTRTQYDDVNGNSNLYFGWGGEDDDLLLRALNKGYERVRENADIYKFQMLHHERNDHHRGNVDRILLLRTAVDRQDFEGLSSTTYTVTEIRHEQLYIWISVSLNMTQLLLTAPDDTLKSIKSLLGISKTIT